MHFKSVSAKRSSVRAVLMDGETEAHGGNLCPGPTPWGQSLALKRRFLIPVSMIQLLVCLVGKCLYTLCMLVWFVPVPFWCLDLLTCISSSQVPLKSKQKAKESSFKVVFHDTWFLLCPVVSRAGVCLGLGFPPTLVAACSHLTKHSSQVSGNKCAQQKESLLEMGITQPDRKRIWLCRCSLLWGT